MKLANLALTVLLSVGSVVSYDPSKPECVAAEKNIGWYQGKYSEVCAVMINECAGKGTYSTWIWGKTACIAAAICTGSKITQLLARCANDNILPREQVPAMSKNVYRNIVGPCADQGCPITQQKYVDWVYGAIKTLNQSRNTTLWPESGEYVVENWWKPLKEWTKTGDVVPYKNLNDFLHYADLV